MFSTLTLCEATAWAPARHRWLSSLLKETWLSPWCATLPTHLRLATASACREVQLRRVPHKPPALPKH